MPDISVSPASLDFGEVEFRRTSEPLTLTISNEGTADLEVTDITVDDNQFSVNFNEPFILAPEQSRDLQVTFTPNVVDVVEAELSIVSNDEDESPYPVALAGIGVWVSPTVLLERLCSQVQDLREEGVLNRGQANSLCTKIRNAVRAIEREQAHVAVNVLNAFINHTEDFVAEGVLTAEQGQPLIDEALFIIALIEEFGIDAFGDQPIGTSVSIPSESYLSQGYPNPFNSATTLQFGLPEASRVTIGVYDITGRLVERLVGGELQAGYHTVVWDAGSMPAGIYLVRMESYEFSKVRKVMLVK